MDVGPVSAGATIARSGTHLHDNARLRRLLHEALPVRRFAGLGERIAAAHRATVAYLDGRGGAG